MKPQEKLSQGIKIIEDVRADMSQVIQANLKFFSGEWWYKRILQWSGKIDSALSNLKDIQNLNFKEEKLKW